MSRRPHATIHDCGRIAILLCACAALLLTMIPGCSPLPRKEKAQETYRLSFEKNRHESPRQMRQNGPVLLVQPLRAASGFDSHQMAYSSAPLKIDYYAKSRWIDSPARMLTPIIAAMLEETGTFRAVVASPSAVRPDYTVSGEVLRFIQEFADKQSVFRMTVKLLISGPDGRLIAEEAFDLTGQCPANDAHGAALAANSLLVRLQEMITDMTRPMK